MGRAGGWAIPFWPMAIATGRRREFARFRAAAVVWRELGFEQVLTAANRSRRGEARDGSVRAGRRRLSGIHYAQRGVHAVVREPRHECLDWAGLNPAELWGQPFWADAAPFWAAAPESPAQPIRDSPKGLTTCGL